MPKLAISLLSSFIEAAEGPRGQALYAPPPTSAYTRTGFGRKGPWMSLEIFDEGWQKPTPVMGDPVSVGEDTDTEGGPGSGGPAYAVPFKHQTMLVSIQM